MVEKPIPKILLLGDATRLFCPEGGITGKSRPAAGLSLMTKMADP